MRIRRFWVATLTIAMFASALTACSNKESTTPATTPATTVNDSTTAGNEAAADQTTSGNGLVAAAVATSNADPTSFFPLKNTGGGKNPLNEIYETLVDQDGPGGKIYGNLAKTWNMDGLDLYVEIYDNIYDSAGNHITADDVIYSYEYSWSQGYTTSKYLSYTDGIEKIDDYNIVFHWKEDQLDTYSAIDSVLLGQFIFSQAAYEASADGMATTPVGTGPYVLKDFMPGSSAVLERRADYWQTDASLVGPQHQANVQTITYKFISDPSQVVNALKSGDIDYADTVDEASLAYFLSSGDWTVVRTYDRNLFCMFFNCLDGTIFHDMNLRAALCYAINSDDIVAAVGGQDFARRVYEYGVPGVTNYNENCESWENYYTVTDLALAKDYLAKSGYAGQTVQIHYYAGEFSTYCEAISLCIGAACDQLGMKYEIHPTNAIEDVISTVNGNWDIVVSNVGGDGNAVDYFRNNFNNGRYEGALINSFDEKIDELYNKTYTASGATPENVSEFNQYLIDNYYVYGMMERITSAVMRSDLIADSSVTTRRSWTLPGSWVYYVD